MPSVSNSVNKDFPILIIGAGSIGERHIRNLWNLGYHNLFVFRIRNLPFRDIAGAQVQVITDWEYINDMRPFAAFICTPTAQHMQQTIDCLQLDMHVFVEKPLSHNLERFDELKELVKEKNKYLQVGYMMRFHPLILQIKDHISNKTYGNLISFHTHWGSYLPNWHPWEDYKNSYAAKKELGGGVALTLSHDLDLANWIVNTDIISHHSIFNRSSQLDIDVESVTDFLIQYNNNITGHVHLNYLEHEPRRQYEFIFEEAVMQMNYFKNELQIISPKGNKNILLQDFDRNDLFSNEVKYFFAQVSEKEDHTEQSLRQINESEIIIKMCNAKY
ncbi:MAG: Gfo/Idh/MocA family oxidoreductase [Fimbriimonadaceae bacterium]|nr:Gfo/Idh/MocA family oxidoreductase [Chitinophagales bacterium]